jgi:hypothetical protein
MDGAVLTDARALDAARLTATLRRVGALVAGAVAAVEVETGEGSWSRNARLRVSYAPGSRGARPTALFLKMSTSLAPRSEVDYYARDYVDLPDRPLPRCYEAVYAPDPPRYHLLLEDLSATHRSNFGRTPTLAYGRALAGALAALHADRWTPTRLVEVGAPPPGRREIETYVAQARPGLEPLLELTGGELAPGWPELLREVFERHPPLMVARAADPRGIALVHGDVNPGNVLSPWRGRGRVYVIDRQPFDWSLRAWLAVSDLAYAVVHWWPTDLRRRLEEPVLRHYHSELARRGVADYPWERLWADYRLAAVQSLYVAVEWCVLPQDRDRMRWVWRPQLDKAMRAFEDLDCRALWRS